MAFEIIRNDITRVKADVLVNSANPAPIYASGTDKAIYTAAGAADLLNERRKIGELECGQVGVTPAFKLNANYIFHTVGPVWQGGKAGELELLASCYRNCLEKAEELHCESIAFPLISTGVYGFPKDRALQVALSVISSFLMTHDLRVILVVFDRSSYVLSSNVFHEVQDFIEEQQVQFSMDKEYGACGESCLSSTRGRPRRRTDREMRMEASRPAKVPSAPPEPVLGSVFSANSVEDILAQKKQSFSQRLTRMMDEKGLDPVEVYHRANLTRQHFHKILNKEGYLPKKNTIYALAMALNLNLEQTTELLTSAGLAFSPDSDFDRVIQFLILKQRYNIVMDVNPVLFQYDLPLLGA